MFLIYIAKVAKLFHLTKQKTIYFLSKSLKNKSLTFAHKPYLKREREAPLSWYTPRML